MLTGCVVNVFIQVKVVISSTPHPHFLDSPFCFGNKKPDVGGPPRFLHYLLPFVSSVLTSGTYSQGLGEEKDRDREGSSKVNWLP